jgi:hypothetical protein
MYIDMKVSVLSKAESEPTPSELSPGDWTDIFATPHMVSCVPVQVRDLMVYIEAQRTIQSEGGSELQDATLLPMPQSQRSSARSSRRSSKK